LRKSYFTCLTSLAIEIKVSRGEEEEAPGVSAGEPEAQKATDKQSRKQSRSSGR
jgi:hypothetical protein